MYVHYCFSDFFLMLYTLLLLLIDDTINQYEIYLNKYVQLKNSEVPEKFLTLTSGYGLLI